MILVDDGGKISHRHDAYYVFADGSQGNDAYLTTQPVRMIMEFDGVSTSAASATLANGQDRSDNIAIGSDQSSGQGATQEAQTAPAQKPSVSNTKLKSH